MIFLIVCIDPGIIDTLKSSCRVTGKILSNVSMTSQSPMRLERLINRVYISTDMKFCHFGCGNDLLVKYSG